MLRKIKITKTDGAWVMGTYGEFNFGAKIFDQPSQFGICEGRVSKLHVTDQNDKLVYNYDRGVDVDHAIGVELANVLENVVQAGDK